MQLRRQSKYAARGVAANPGEVLVAFITSQRAQLNTIYKGMQAKEVKD